MVYNIIEVANAHGGDLEYLLELIEEFSEYRNGYGIKFQPFHFDTISTPDYESYEVYRKLFFSLEEWDEVIGRANETKDIWLDLFDDFGVEVLKESLFKVHGIKLQSSVLQNKTLRQHLSRIDLSEKVLMINVAGYHEDELEPIISRYSRLFTPKELILQVGFQAYPTQFDDSGLCKIGYLRKCFPFRVCFADHLAPSDVFSTWGPLMAILGGAEYVEKHVKHSTRETLYDYQSSLDHHQYKEYVAITDTVMQALHQPFVNEREASYLRSTIQIPLAKSTLRTGQAVCTDDLVYRRSGQRGLTSDKLLELSKSHHVLNRDISTGETFLLRDFRRAIVGTIVAGRMKSTRLPKKATLTLGQLTSVEVCLRSCCRFENIHYIALATSTLPEDQVLSQFTYNSNVHFFQGHPEDVIQRYLAVADELKLDVIVRVTADCPFVSNEILQVLLASHFESGADFTQSIGAPVGLAPEVINVAALKRVKEYFPSADYSEYMSWYFTNNEEHFRVNKVFLEPEFRRNFRLTLDYPEDLVVLRAVEERFEECDGEFSTAELLSYLDENPKIADTNAHCVVRYQADSDLIERLNSATRIRS